jgi:hypothetical protein
MATPAPGSTLSGASVPYVRLWTLPGSTWQFNDYT